MLIPIYSLTGPKKRGLTIFLSMTVVLLIFAPLLAAIYFRLEHLTYANESLAYRYFYTLRILSGEQGVWAAQGFTLSVVQFLFHWITGSLSTDIDKLRNYLDLFGYATNGLVAGFQAAVFMAAIRSRYLTAADCLLVTLSILAPVYATGQVGIYYTLLPDYYSLNVALNSLALLFFILGVRRQQEFPSWGELFGVSIAAGVMIANKVSMLPVAAMMLFPWVLMGGSLRWSTLLAKVTFVACASLAVAITIIFCFFLFDLSSLVLAVTTWSQFVFDPGTEPNFWASIMVRSKAYNYHWFAGIASMVALFSAHTLLVQVGGRARNLILMLSILLVAVSWGYFIWKRPANTTLFEANNVLIIIMAALAVLPMSHEVRRNMVTTMAVLIGFIAILTFPLASQLGMLKVSRDSGDNRWKFFNEVRQLSGSEPVTVILATNEFGHGGVHELLLKGTSIPPTWEVGEGGHAVLRRLGLQISFKHYHSGVGEFGQKLPAGNWILWFEKPGRYQILEMTPPLNRLLIQGVPTFSWHLPGNYLLPAIDAYMLKVPD